MVRAHVRALLDRGMLLADVAGLAGLAVGHLTKLMYWPHYRQVTPEVAQAILGATYRPSLRYLVDGTGTRRRLRALCAIGWTYRHIAADLGVDDTTPQKWCVYRSVTRDTANRVADLYKRWSETPGPSARSRLRAAAKGWTPPIGWDDDTIDDPAAEPQLELDPDPEYVDEVKVQRVLSGLRTNLTDAELLAVLIAGLRRGEAITSLCERLGVGRHRADRLLATLEPAEDGVAA